MQHVAHGISQQSLGWSWPLDATADPHSSYPTQAAQIDM